MSFKTWLNTQRDKFGLIDHTISYFNKIGKYHNQINAFATDAERGTEHYFIDKEYSNVSDKYEEAMELPSDWKAKFVLVFPAGKSTFLDNSRSQQQQGDSLNIKRPQSNKFSRLI